MLCFRRDYSPAHLAQHPKQTTRSVLLAFQEGFVSIVLTPQHGFAKEIGAGCDWAQGRDRYLRPQDDSQFRPRAGFGASSPSAIAPERGYLLIDPAQDAKSATLFLAKFDRRRQQRAEKAEDLELGPEDLAFKLTRIGSKACEAFQDEIE